MAEIRSSGGAMMAVAASGMRAQQARMQYDAAIGFYQKSMALLRMASRPPGR